MLSCRHERAPFGDPICEHLRAQRGEQLSYVRWFTGAGTEVVLICSECAARRRGGVDEGRAACAQVCEECFDLATDALGVLTGVEGSPEVRSRSLPFELDVREFPLPPEFGRVVALAPVDGVPSVWLLLAEDGKIVRVDLSRGESEVAGASAWKVPEEHASADADGQSRGLHVSPDGRFAAVVHDYGEAGEVIDLVKGQVTVHLHGGAYHARTVPFAFGFASVGGRVAAIHRTDWNRVDLSDAATGKLLTERGTAAGEDDGGSEPHLDYFYGALYLNPSRTRVASDGWVWHPVGVVTTWSLSAWANNVWEPETGPSNRTVCSRVYCWDRALVWLDDTRLAVSGIGDDDSDMIEGARVFDVTQLAGEAGPWVAETKAEVMTFAGPSGVFLSDGKSLFASDGAGLTRWDPSDGCRTGEVAGFAPTQRHAGSGEFVQLVEGRLLRWCVDAPVRGRLG